MGCVLAGGRSTRMGRDKSTLPHPSGGTFLEFAVARLEACCDTVVVSRAHDHAPPPTDGDIRQLRDRLVDRGPVGGLVVSLVHADRIGAPACFVTPVDVPDLTVDDCRMLLEDWRRHPKSIVVARGRIDDRLQPLVAVYPVNWLGPLQVLAESDDRSLYRFLMRCDQASQCRFVTLPDEHLRNVNSMEG